MNVFILNYVIFVVCRRSAVRVTLAK